MIEQHAQRHADRIRFPPNQGKDYIIERGKYTKMAYGRLQQNWQNAEDAVNEAYLMLLKHPITVKTQEEYEALFTTVLMGVIGKMFRTEKAKERGCVGDFGKYVQYLEVEEESDLDEYSKREEIIAIVDEETCPEIKALANELLNTINAEIDRLKFKARQIIALNVLYGYKPREIMDITGDTSASIRMTIFHFREQMKGVLT